MPRKACPASFPMHYGISHGVRSYEKGNMGNMREKRQRYIDNGLLYLPLEEFLSKKLILIHWRETFLKMAALYLAITDNLKHNQFLSITCIYLLLLFYNI